MDKEEYRIKLEQINHLVETKDYKGAMEVVDSIDWRRVKNVRTLCVVGEIYAANKRYEDARDIFLLAYHRSSIGKNILIRLFDISLKLGDIEEATDYYEEFKSVSPNDNTAYVLHYKLLKAKKADVKEQMAVLEDYKKKEFTEKWSFELAKLYFENGQKEKCLELCNEIILWFSEGSYVMKALDLKMRMGEMTEAERKAYEQKFIPKLHTKEELEKEAQKQEEPSAEDSKEEETEEKEEETSAEKEIREESQKAEEEISEEVEKAKEEAEESEKTELDASDEFEEDTDEFEEEDPENETDRIGKIRVKNNKELEETETFQERISKGLRDLFGVKKKAEPEEFEDEDDSDDYEEEESEEPKKEEKEILIDDVPELEKEGEEKKTSPVDFSKTMKMPELKIPRSMRRNAVKENVSEEVEEEKISEEPKEEEKSDFNLEDAILAAASAQGIEIPEVNSEEEKESQIADLSEDEIPKEESFEETEEESPAENDSEKEAEKTEDAEEKIEIAAIPDLEMEDLEESKEEPLSRADQLLQSILDWEEVQGSKYQKSGMQTFRREKKEGCKKSVLVEEEKVSENSPKKASENEHLTEEEKIERFIDSIQPKEEREPEEIIPRGEELTEEEKKLFSYFVKVPGMKEQLIDTLITVQEEASNKTSKSGNIIVMGGPESGKTRLISGLIPAICKELNLQASKVAYVFADQINGKDIDQIFRKLAGGFFVIEKANQLDQATVAKLDTAMERNTGGMIVVLEDDKIGMRKFVARYPKLARKFTSTINIPVFTNDELANFAKIYAMENGYRIDNMGMLALYNLIGMNQKEDMPMNIGAVKNMVDAAVSKSQGGLFKKSSKKKLDRDGFIVLHEKDFNFK